MRLCPCSAGVRRVADFRLINCRITMEGCIVTMQIFEDSVSNIRTTLNSDLETDLESEKHFPLSSRSASKMYRYDQRKDVFAYFIDYEKAFDRIRHEKLIKILEEQSIDNKNIRIIKNLYWKQKMNIQIQEKVSRAIPIKREVRQGCICHQ